MNLTKTSEASLSSQTRTEKREEFKVSSPFIKWPAILVTLNAVIIVIGILIHQIPWIALFGMMMLAFLCLLLSAVTLRISMTDTGLKQRWIWGWRAIEWTEVASIERVRRRFFGEGLYLLNSKNHEIFAVSSLPIAAQEIITAEAVKQARLRRDKKPLKRPVVERWVQK